MVLELKEIYKDYIQGKESVPVLKNINLCVNNGEYLAIMGPSGSGKSTLMNIIGCLDRQTSGTFLFEDTNVFSCKDRELSEIRNKKIGFVFQNFNLLPRQTALENVELPLLYAGVNRKERRERAREALVKVGLEDRISFRPTQLSGGQKQRVAIARAMVNSPLLLLADEPTGALDTASGEQVMELFQKLNEESVTIVMITHEREIADHAKRIIFIRDGILTDNSMDINGINETNGINEINEMYGINITNEISETNETNEISQTNEANEISQTNEINETNEINGINGGDWT